MSMKKRVTISLLLLMLAMVLAGCGGISKKKEQAARELIDKMITAADGAVVSKVDASTELETEMLFGDETLYWSAKYESHNEYDKESGRVESEVVYYADEKPVTVRFHMADEMGVFYIYTNKDNAGWFKYDSCFLKDDMSRNFIGDMNLENAEIVDFMENYKKVNEKNVHWLRVELKDASIRELVFEAGLKEFFWGSEYNSVDLSDISVVVDYYVDTATNQVVELEVKLDGMKNFFNDFMEYNENLGVKEEYKDVKINKCKLIYSNISYEDIKVPMLSFEDKKSSLLIYQEDTIYDLKTMESEAQVLCPKGWAVTEKGVDIIRIAKPGEGLEVNYILYFPYTLEDAEESIAHEIESIKDMGNYHSDKKGEMIGDFETYEVALKEGKLVYAYTAIGRNVIMVLVENYTDNEQAIDIEAILEPVKYKEIEW